MTKKELVDRMAKEAGISRTVAGVCMDSVIEAITTSVKDGENVALQGFGTFSRVERAAREGRNPQTGEALHIEASSSVKFKASKILKGDLNV